MPSEALNRQSAPVETGVAAIFLTAILIRLAGISRAVAHSRSPEDKVGAVAPSRDLPFVTLTLVSQAFNLAALATEEWSPSED